MADEHLDDVLSRMGREPVPPLDGAFANRLEADLRDQNMAGVRPLRQPAWWLRPSTVVALGLLAVVIGVASGLIGQNRSTIEITTASGSSVSVPGSSELIPGEPGMRLEDGTRIEVGPDGMVTVGGVVLEAGTTAFVESGSLAIVDAPESTPRGTVPPQNPDESTSTTGVTSTSADIAAPATGAPTPAPTATSSSTSPTTSVAQTRPTTTIDTREPTTTAPATTVPETRPKPTSTTTPTTTTTTTTTKPRDLAIAVEFADVGDRTAWLTWNIRPTDAQIAGWEVQARRGDSVSTIATLRQPEARRLRIEVSKSTVDYRVRARGREGAILGESRWISP